MKPKIYSAEAHQIDIKRIDPDALYVLLKLRDTGHIAYLVGGSVRDLINQKNPKDFDISTSATPEELKSIFGRRALLIGRRFRLAHIRFGNKVIEVSTFRSGDIDDEALIVKDNQWGDPEEDVLRRDFTINGLFYESEHQTIIDYVGGWEDIQAGILRTIGTAEKRFTQDPVRMIRLLKFKARFGFTVEAQTQEALLTCKGQITKSSPARILEEMLRMLESGASATFFKLMVEHGLFKCLFPPLNHFLISPHGQECLKLLQAADSLNLSLGTQTLERATLLCCLLFPILEFELVRRYLTKEITPKSADILLLVQHIIEHSLLAGFAHFPRRLTAAVEYILTAQYRLTPLSKRHSSSLKLLTNTEFPLALSFLKVRAHVHPALIENYNWWEQQQREGHHGERLPHPHIPVPPLLHRRET